MTEFLNRIELIIALAILVRILHHCQVINIKGESYRLKERRKLMREKQKRINTLSRFITCDIFGPFF